MTLLESHRYDGKFREEREREREEERERERGRRTGTCASNTGDSRMQISSQAPVNLPGTGVKRWVVGLGEVEVEDWSTT